jgi:hypothetical protein
MDCKAIQEQLSEYMDGRLSEGERREIAAHLDACPACREALEQLQKVVDLVGELPYVTAPEGLHEKILRQNLKVVPGEEKPFALPPRYSRWLPLMRGMAAAAVLVLFAFLGHELIDPGPVAPESAVPVGMAAEDRDPKIATGEDGSRALKDAEPVEEEVEGESTGKPLRDVVRRGLKKESDKDAGGKREDGSVEDKLDKVPATKAGRKYRGGRGKGSREPAEAGDEEGEWAEESEADAEGGSADRRGPRKDAKGPGQSRPAEKGRLAGKPDAPGDPHEEPALAAESKKKGEAPAARGRGESGGGAGGKLQPKKKERSDWAPGSPEPMKRRGRTSAKGKEVPVTLLVFTADATQTLAGIETDLSRLKGKKAQRAPERKRAGVLEEAAKKLADREKGDAGREERKQDGAPSPGGGGAEPGAEDAPPAEGGTPAPTPQPEEERAFGAAKQKKEKESKSHEGQKEAAEADDLGEDPKGGPAKAEDLKKGLERLRAAQARFKGKEVVKVLLLTLSQYRELKERMANRETRFREDPTNLYLAFLKRLRKETKAGFFADGPAEGTLLKVTLRFKAPDAPKAGKEGAKAPAPQPSPAPRPSGGVPEGTEKEEKPEKKE